MRELLPWQVIEPSLFAGTITVTCDASTVLIFALHFSTTFPSAPTSAVTAPLGTELTEK